MAHERLPDLTQAQRAATTALSNDARRIQAPVWLAQQAHLPNDVTERQHAAQDPDGFWREKAKLLDWMKPFELVSRFAPPRHEWFVGGKLNATANCIDRHTLGDRRLKAALIWVGEDGEEHTYTYNRLYREVNRFANALKKLGVQKGDRVVVYMPLVPEGIISMLACARIGAIHAVVLAGMGAQALRARIEDCGAKVVICSDFALRRGKRLALKPTLDEAVRELYSVEHVIVHRRGSRPGDAPFTFESEREHDFYDVQDGHAIHCPPEPMDSEDPLFILYASGTTGRPKGIVHTTGGYLVGTHLSLPRLLPAARPRHLLVHLRHRLDRRTLLHRLRAALDRRDRLLPRGRAGLPLARRHLGAVRAVRRQRDVDRPHRAPPVHEPRRGRARALRSDSGSGSSPAEESRSARRRTTGPRSTSSASRAAWWSTTSARPSSPGRCSGPCRPSTRGRGRSARPSRGSTRRSSIRKATSFRPGRVGSSSSDSRSPT